MALGASCRRGPAAATTSLLAFGTLLLDYAQKLWPPLGRIGWISPFKYNTPFEHVVGSPFHFENFLVLWAVAMTGFILAYLVISQRDIHR
jgi:hypothetical protein